MLACLRGLHFRFGICVFNCICCLDKVGLAETLVCEFLCLSFPAIWCFGGLVLISVWGWDFPI